MERWGINGKRIPEDAIPYDSSRLHDGDTIHSDEATLKYSRDLRGYVIVTDDPCNTFLTDKQRSTNWESWEDEDCRKLGYKSSGTEFKGVVLTLEDGSKLVVPANNYFTPDLEDVRIGYKCEVNASGLAGGRDNWIDHTIESAIHIQGLESMLKAGSVRVPFLTKEQIEAEGWIDEGNNFFNLKGSDRWYFSWYPEMYRIEFCDQENEKGFAGEIKSINEFRYICKLLKIN